MISVFHSIKMIACPAYPQKWHPVSAAAISVEKLGLWEVAEPIPVQSVVYH